MVISAFPGHDLPIAAQELIPKTPSKTLKPQNLALGPCRCNSYLPPRTPLHRAHRAQTEKKRRSLRLVELL